MSFQLALSIGSGICEQDASRAATLGSSPRKLTTGGQWPFLAKNLHSYGNLNAANIRK